MKIRFMQPEDFNWAIEQANKEQWNPGKYDLASYYAFDPQGHYIMEDPDADEDEKRIGCISAVSYGNFAFVGFYIVVPEKRGKGYGKQLWQHAMERIVTIGQHGLYAVPQEVSRYSAAGFKAHHGNLQYSRKTPAINTKACDKVVKFDTGNPYFSKVSAYDKQLFAAPRSELLRAMLNQQEASGLVYVNEEKVAGYCMIRALHDGFRVGPLYANEPDVAKALMNEAMRVVGEENKIVLNSSQDNTNIHWFAEFFGLDKVLGADLTAMFKGGEPENLKENKGKRYATLSLEVG